MIEFGEKEYSAKELCMFEALAIGNMGTLIENLDPVALYEHTAMIAFRQGMSGLAVDSLRRCCEALSACKPYRRTKEWDALIDLEKVLEVVKSSDIRSGNVRENLASYAHEAWCGWMIYMFSKCVRKNDGTMSIPKWAVDRWVRQSNTKYLELPESEKKSDREEAEKIFKVIHSS